MEVRYLPCGRKTGRYAIMFNLGFGNNFRSQFGQQQQQPFDFQALDTRLGKMETGIASLTDQFRDLSPGPSPLEVEPTPAGIESLPTPGGPGGFLTDPGFGGENAAVGPGHPDYEEGTMTALPTPQNAGFNFDPSGGSLMSQLSSAYGGQTHNEQMGRAPAGFTQGFSDFFTGEGYYADPRPTAGDAPWSITDKPIDMGPKMGGVLNPYGYSGSFTGNLEEFNPINKPTSQPGRPLQQQMQPQIGAGLTGLAAYQSQNKGMV